MGVISRKKLEIVNTLERSKLKILGIYFIVGKNKKIK